MPYLVQPQIRTYDEMRACLSMIFEWMDYIHFISTFGGEPFSNPDFTKILKLLLFY